MEDRQYSRGVLYLVERPAQAWHAAFSAAGLRVVGEPVMPQFEIACLRGLTWVIGLVHKPSSADVATQQSAAESAAKSEQERPAVPLSLKRRILRAGLQLARRLILWICYPIDHWLRLPLPPPRFRSYRIFVLGKNQP